jgi:hypothetical protein
VNQSDPREALAREILHNTGNLVFVDSATDSARQALVRADVGVAFATEDSLPAILQTCAEWVVRHVEVAIARIWTADKDRDVLEIFQEWLVQSALQQR